jgi:hypothetical protein
MLVTIFTFIQKRTKIMYDTYKQAKLANPDSEVVTTGPKWDGRESSTGKFQAMGRHVLADHAWVICDPADHCETLTQFEKVGKALETGDKVIVKGDDTVFTIDNASMWDTSTISNAEEIYILEATADKVESNWPQPGEKVITSLGVGEFVAKVVEYDVIAYIVQFDDNWEAFTIDGLKPYDEDYENAKALYQLAMSLSWYPQSNLPFSEVGDHQHMWIELAKRVEVKHD